jgi:hypothetical protein
MEKPRIIRSLVGVLLILLVLEGSYSGFRALSIGGSYSTGYQGARARFAGVQSSGSRWSSANGSLFDTTLFWDKDKIGEGSPAVAGEMTSVFIPRESVGGVQRSLGGYDISKWLLDSATTKNPVQNYDWTLSEGNTTISYRMEEWSLRWYFSISSEPTNNEIAWTDIGRLSYRNSLKDTKVWFEFDLTPIWYFENTSTAYFAIAELRIGNVALGGKLGGSTYEEKANTEMRVAPMSAGSIMPIYYGLFGSEANRADKSVYSYQGKKLNPTLFTDRVFSYFNLQDFGESSWWDFGTRYKGDVVTIGVEARIFVVGEWKVQNVDELPDVYGRDAIVGGSGLGLGDFFFGSSEGRLLLLAIGAVAVFLILALFAPWVLILLFSLFRAFRSDKK